MRETIDRKGMSVLSSGHLATDFASGAVPALLPFFTVKFDLSYTLTAVLILAALISSSVVQPLFGLWSDRRGALWLLPAGLGLAGAGLGLAAVAPSYPMLVVLVFIAGIGIAAFHPEGAKFAVFLSGKKRASGMSLFNIGGNLGYALGPIIVTPLVLWLGLGPGGLLASVPVLIASVAVLGALPYLARRRPQHDGGVRDAGAEDDVRAMLILAAVIGLRSVAWFTLIAFVPLWAVSQGDTEAEGNRLAVPDAARRRGRNAVARPDRRPLRNPADAARRPGVADAADPRVRAAVAGSPAPSRWQSSASAWSAPSG